MLDFSYKNGVSTILYKYTYKRHAINMTRKGVFRIGTLFNYRDIENHDHGVGDKDEGIKNIYCDDPVVDFRHPETVPGFVKKHIRTPNVDANIIFKNIVFRETQRSLNYFLFSMTQVFDSKAMHKLGYDSCVRIDNPKIFFQTITKCLRNKVSIKSGFYVAKCVYIDRQQHYSQADNIHPALIKDPSYAYQNEVRAIWTPQLQEIEPVILECRSARNFCRLMI